MKNLPIFCFLLLVLKEILSLLKKGKKAKLFLLKNNIFQKDVRENNGS